MLKIPSNMGETARNLVLGLLNRNPNKRLGAGPKDAEEIKNHPWFSDIKWSDVYEKKLKPPKPVFKFPSLESINKPEVVIPTAPNVTGNKVEGWSFIHSDQL